MPIATNFDVPDIAMYSVFDWTAASDCGKQSCLVKAYAPIAWCQILQQVLDPNFSVVALCPSVSFLRKS